MTTWKAIPGWEGCYEVSDDGQVRSLARTVGARRRGTRLIEGRILRPSTARYPVVQLCRDGKRTHRSVHSLVALAFLGPRPEGYEVCHLDDIKTNNVLSNLRYGTPSSNHLDLVRNGRNHNSNKTHCVNGHEFNQENTSWNGTQRRCKTCCRDRMR